MPTIMEVLKIVPGLILLPFSIYFMYLKIGNKVGATYSITHQRHSASRFSEVVLVNKKDKPISIHSIYASIDRDIVLCVQTFKPALTIKGLETTSIQTDELSSYHLNGDEYALDPRHEQLVELHLVTSSGVIRCNSTPHPSTTAITEFNKYSLATRETQKYNGLVYNGRIKYAILYKLDGITNTALVEESGFISVGWNLLPNRLRVDEQMSSPKAVKEALLSTELKYLFKNSDLIVQDIRNSENFA